MTKLSDLKLQIPNIELPEINFEPMVRGLSQAAESMNTLADTIGQAFNGEQLREAWEQFHTLTNNMSTKTRALESFKISYVSHVLKRVI